MRKKIFTDLSVTGGEFTSIVRPFSKGGAYIPASSAFVGKKVKVIVLPEEPTKN